MAEQEDFTRVRAAWGRRLGEWQTAYLSIHEELELERRGERTPPDDKRAAQRAATLREASKAYCPWCDVEMDVLDFPAVINFSGTYRKLVVLRCTRPCGHLAFFEPEGAEV